MRFMSSILYPPMNRTTHCQDEVYVVQAQIIEVQNTLSQIQVRRGWGCGVLRAHFLRRMRAAAYCEFLDSSHAPHACIW